MQLSGDKALSTTEDDRLGFDATAQAIASAIIKQTAVDGLVIGIEGRWGSGKSSLVNMALSALRESENPAEVVEFKPWLIGDRDNLMLALFTELAIAVDAIEAHAGDPSAGNRRELGDAGKKIIGFATQLGGLGSLAKVAGLAVPGAAVAGEVLHAIAEAAKGVESKRSLANEKAALRKRLAALPRRVVISIDDVDRLEPSEVVEILRLVRSVADFPNVIYLLCYDAGIVSHSIEAAARVENGRAYIEKIVQIAIPVPRPESFDLRRWFSEGIDALPYDIDEAGEGRSRLTAVVDLEGGRYLTTPRHVVRCLDSLRFFWRALHAEVDLADLVWLHLVKIGNPDLYAWAEGYLSEVAARASGMAMITSEDRRASRELLDKALEVEGSDYDNAYVRLADFIPALSHGGGAGQEKDPGVHAQYPKENVARAVQSRRLASPDHYRLYFAVQQPRNSPRTADFDALAEALGRSAGETGALLKLWAQDHLSTGATKAEIMLSRIAYATEPISSPTQARRLLVALANHLDELATVRDDRFRDPLIWVEGQRVLKSTLAGLGNERRAALSEMFSGAALDWLTTLLRNETFAHGRVADARARGEQLVDAEELDLISSLMVNRYRELTLQDWKKLRQPISALYAWRQAGDPDGPSQLLEKLGASDADFLEILDLLSSHITSSDYGQKIIIKGEILDHFMDRNKTKNRLDDLAENAEDRAIRSRAAEMLKRYSDSRHY